MLVNEKHISLIIRNKPSTLPYMVDPSVAVVSCPARLALMCKHHLVTMLEFLGPRSAIQPKYWLAFRIDKLHNRMNLLEVNEKADDLKPFIRSYSPTFKMFVVKLFFPISPYES